MRPGKLVRSLISAGPSCVSTQRLKSANNIGEGGGGDREKLNRMDKLYNEELHVISNLYQILVPSNQGM
jgi:hypothetical protein